MGGPRCATRSQRILDECLRQDPKSGAQQSTFICLQECCRAVAVRNRPGGAAHAQRNALTDLPADARSPCPPAAADRHYGMRALAASTLAVLGCRLRNTVLGRSALGLEVGRGRDDGWSSRRPKNTGPGPFRPIRSMPLGKCCARGSPAQANMTTSSSGLAPAAASTVLLKTRWSRSFVQRASTRRHLNQGEGQRRATALSGSSQQRSNTSRAPIALNRYTC